MTICNKPNLPIVAKDGNSVTLKIEDGKSVIYKRIGTELVLPKIIAQGITRYSTDSDPDISETELESFKQDVYEKFLSIHDRNFEIAGGVDGSVVKDSLLTNFERLFESYAKDKKITPDEYTKMLKVMLDSACRIKKEIVSPEKEQLTNKTKAENKATNEPGNKYWFGGLIDLGRAIVGTVKGD